MVHDGCVEELGSAAQTLAVMPDPADTPPIVLPAESDPMLEGATDRLGGHLGTRASAVRRFWTPIRILIILTSTAFTLGYISKLPCHAESFGGDARYTRLCYSDIPFLYQLRGFADGWLPYIDTGPGRGPALEYPVLTGVFMPALRG